MQTEAVLIESAVKPHFVLSVDGKEYRVEFPLSAVIAAEEKVGHSLKTPADWFGAPSKDIPALLEAGLAKHHPEITSDEVQAICNSLDPESCVEVTEALGALAFPKWLSRFKENLQKLKEKGDTSPNGQSAAVR